ncbi:hypothetical protein [Methylocystis sp. Sn-Cys]|uniref:hypothetical protein n=1 Tax=Methylocystis sp. Sn-Cys TaxID=1701263 RepID=UPI0019250533|nr:hypothetical protein [Methylocystis sp. Sn-Cys]MBL1258881.1 hypothetical protein [Methylocystis sp. Sn-Cys]
MALVAIDWLVLHATIFQANADSYRRKAVLKKQFVDRAPACTKTKLDLDYHSATRAHGGCLVPACVLCSAAISYSA